MRRALHLAKERLSPLDAASLPKVVGGASVVLDVCIDLSRTLQVDCLNDNTFEYCPEPRTLPLEQCV